MSKNSLLSGSHQPSLKPTNEQEITPNSHNPLTENIEKFKTASLPKVREDMKENVNFYMTENRKQNLDQHNLPNRRSTGSFPKPPLVSNQDEGSSENLLLSSMLQDNSDSGSSNNEIENII